MHNLAAYAIEATVDAKHAAQRLAKFDELVTTWLTKKNADAPSAAEGSFVSKSGDGTGQFARRVVTASVGVLHEVELIETAHNGEMFTTLVQAAYHEGRISVYATLGSSPVSVVVTSGGLHPKCPEIIRSLLEVYGDWDFGGWPVPNGLSRPAISDEEVYDLCDRLESPDRRLPVVVASTDKVEALWLSLEVDLGQQLIGLAEVAHVDADSSWTLTDEMGKSASCYLGAVRIYWPGLRKDGTLFSQVWSVSRQETFGTDDDGKRRFLSMMRKTVLTAAALTIDTPRGVREVLLASSQERLQAKGEKEREEAVRSLLDENARLSAKLAEANKIVAVLRLQVEPAKGDTDDVPQDVEGGKPEHQPPKKDEVRFYKKRFSSGGVDRMVIVGNCTHGDSWKPAFSGDQAEKGILRLEGRDDWQSLSKCPQCENGGRWRVRW